MRAAAATAEEDADSARKLDRLLAGWGGVDIINKMSQEASASSSSVGKEMQLLVLKEPQTRIALDYIHASSCARDWFVVSNPLEFQVLRQLAKLRRAKGNGLFLLVYLRARGRFAFRFRSFSDLSLLSAAFEPPGNAAEITACEDSLLLEQNKGLVEYQTTCGNWICTLSPSFNDLSVFDKREHVLCRNIKEEFDVQVICGSFLGLCTAFTLHAAWDAASAPARSLPPPQPPTRQCAALLKLNAWWATLEESTRRSILPGASSLEDALLSIPFGVDSTLLEEIMRCREQLTSQALLREEEKDRDCDEGKMRTPRRRKRKTVTSAVRGGKERADSDGLLCQPLAAAAATTTLIVAPTSTAGVGGGESCSSSDRTFFSDDDACVAAAEEEWETVSRRPRSRSSAAATTAAANSCISGKGKTRASSLVIELSTETSLPLQQPQAADSKTSLAPRVPPSPAMAITRAQDSPPTPPLPLPHGNLHQDISEMASALDLVAMRRQPWQLAIAERVKQVVYSIWPRAWVDVFGSIASGLASPCSDVDIVVRGAAAIDNGLGMTSYYGSEVFGSAHEGASGFSSSSSSVTRILANQLVGQDWVQMLQVVDRTAVPVVKFNTAAIPIAFGNRGNLIAVDITFENESHHGLNTCGLVRQFVLRWPALKPLVLVLKQFLVEKGLNDAFVGGVSSYGLVLMVAFVCRRQQQQQQLFASSPNQQGGADDLGQLLVEFLRLYSSPDFPQHGISLNHVELVRKPARFLSDPCYIEDPLDPSNNVGRSLFGIRQVQAVFATALDAITTYKPTPNTSALGRVFATSHHNDVVRLVTAVWCPIEVPPAASAVTATTPKTASSSSHWTAIFSSNNTTSTSTVTASNTKQMEAWAEEVRDALLNAASRAQTGQVDECPMCNQKLGPSHLPAKCGFMILAKKCPQFPAPPL